MVRRAPRPCSYQVAYQDETRDIQSDTAPSSVAIKQALRNDFPRAFFLDPALFNYCAPPSTPHSPSIPRAVEALLGDSDSEKVLAAEYFKIADRWMPNISRMRFYGSLINPATPADPKIAAILLAMKLILSCPEDANFCSEIYAAAKDFQLRMEMAGYLTIYILQSAILLTMYELGHAIFPGAFTFVSICSHYAPALKIDETLLVHGQT